jgi:hypothetical protein
MHEIIPSTRSLSSLPPWSFGEGARTISMARSLDPRIVGADQISSVVEAKTTLLAAGCAGCHACGGFVAQHHLAHPLLAMLGDGAQRMLRRSRSAPGVTIRRRRTDQAQDVSG